MKTLIALALVMLSAQIANAQPARPPMPKTPIFTCALEPGKFGPNSVTNAIISRQILQGGGQRLIVELRNGEPRVVKTLWGAYKKTADGAYLMDKPLSPQAVRPGFNEAFSYKDGKGYWVRYADFIRAIPVVFTCHAIRRPFEGGGAR